MTTAETFEPLRSRLPDVLAVPIVLYDRPGMALVEPGRRPAGIFIAENPSAQPVAGLIATWDGPDDFEPKLGDTFRNRNFSSYAPLGWLSGHAFVWSLQAARQMRVDLVPDPGEPCLLDLGARIRAALPACGFSPSFVEALECLAEWGCGARETSPYPLFGPDEASRRLRAIALAHPFATMLALDEAAPRTWEGPATAEEATGLPAAHLRRMAGPAWRPYLYRGSGPNSFEGCGRHAETFLDLLRAVPADWLPSTPEGVTAMSMAAASLAAVTEATGRPIADLVAPCKGDWVALARRLGRPGLPAHRRYSSLAILLSETPRDLAAVLVAPLFRRAGHPEALRRRASQEGPIRDLANRLAYGDKSAAACLEVSDRWHRRIEAMAAERGRARLHEPWPAPWKDQVIVLPGGSDRYLVTALDTEAKLRAEGGKGADADGMPGLDHCVATYAPRARAGDCHIVSIRLLAAGGTRRLATAELAEHRTRERLSVVQLQGRRNGPPPPEARRALEAWLSTNVPPPMATRRRPERHRDHVAEACGHDWADDAALARTVAAYAWMLPRDLRDLASLERAARAWIAAIPPRHHEDEEDEAA